MEIWYMTNIGIFGKQTFVGGLVWKKITETNPDVKLCM